MTRRRRQQGRRRRGQDGAPGSSERREGGTNPTTSLDPARGWGMTAAMLGLPALTAAAVFANTLSNKSVYDDGLTLKWIPSFSIATVFDGLHRTRGLTYAVHSLDKWL